MLYKKKTIIEKGTKRRKKPFLVLVLMLALALLVATPALAQVNQSDQTGNAKSGSASNSASVSGGGGGGADSNQCAQILQASNSGNQQNQQDANQYQNNNEASGGQVSGSLSQQGNVSQSNNQSIDLSPEAVQKCQQEALAAAPAADPSSSSASSAQEEGKDKKDDSAKSSSSSGDTTTTTSSSSDNGGGPISHGSVPGTNVQDKPLEATGDVERGPCNASGCDNYFLANYSTNLPEMPGGAAISISSSQLDLSAYVGERVIVDGLDHFMEGGPGYIRVEHIKPAGPKDAPTLHFELSVACQPSEGTSFYGIVRDVGEVKLTDKGGHGVYQGDLTLTPGAFPPPPNQDDVIIVEVPHNGDESSEQLIKDFGQVTLDGDKYFQSYTSPSSCDGDQQGGTTTPDTSSGSGSSSSGSDGFSASVGGSGGTVSSSADTGSANDDNASFAQYQQYGGSANRGGSSAIGSGKKSQQVVGAISGAKGVLPMTGGAALPVIGGVGVLLIGGGLLVRRIFR